MKKILTLIAIFMVSMVFVFAVQPVQAKTIKLSFSIFFPSTHRQCKAAVQFANEVEEMTNGKVEINEYPGGTLTKAPQCYDGVVKGISDMGFSLFAYTRGRFPVMETVDLPMGYQDGIQASMVAHEFAKQVNPKELHDVKVLYLHAHGPGLLHTKKKPIKSVEDVQGMKIRSTGFSAKVVEALGGTPVAMSQGDAYEALQKGVVDGTFAPIEVLKGWKQAEVIDYTTNCYTGSYTTAMFIIMNKDKWNSLPADVQKVFDELSDKYAMVHGKAWNKADQEGREYTKELGNEIIELSDAELKKFDQATDPVIDKFIAEDPKNDEYVQKVEELMQEYAPENR